MINETTVAVFFDQVDIRPQNIPKVESLWERQRKLKLQDNMVNKLKTLFRFIYYHNGVRFANKERIAEIEKKRRVTFSEILDLNDDINFWTKWFCKLRPHFTEQHVFNLYPIIFGLLSSFLKSRPLNYYFLGSVRCLPKDQNVLLEDHVYGDHVNRVPQS